MEKRPLLGKGWDVLDWKWERRDQPCCEMLDSPNSCLHLSFLLHKMRNLVYTIPKYLLVCTSTIRLSQPWIFHSDLHRPDSIKGSWATVWTGSTKGTFVAPEPMWYLCADLCWTQPAPSDSHTSPKFTTSGFVTINAPSSFNTRRRGWYYTRVPWK